VFNIFPLKRLLQQITVSLLYVTIPNFEVPTWEIWALSGGQLIFFTPVVTDETIDAWESYLTQNQEWIHEGLHVMEDGYQVYDEQVMNHTDPGKIPPFVHILQGDKVCKSVLHGVYAPLWPYAPPPTLAHHVNLELLSTLEWFISLTEQVQYGHHPILSEPINFTTALLPPSSQLSQEEGEESAASEKQEEFTLQSILLYPIFENVVPDAAIQGYLVAVLPWENYLLPQCLTSAKTRRTTG